MNAIVSLRHLECPRAPEARSRRRQAPAFTLVELLVVISVVALLVAILLPGLRKRREQARSVSCLSNLREIAAAGRDYLNDHGGHFLKGTNVHVNWGGRQGEGADIYGRNPSHPVPKPLNSYLGFPDVVRDDADVFRCPGDQGSETIRPSYFRYHGMSYIANQLLIGKQQLVFPFSDPTRRIKSKLNKRLLELNLSTVSANPSHLILLGDYGWWHAWDYYSRKEIEFHGKPWNHNLAFLDAHAASVKIQRGLHVTPEYTVIPFQDLHTDAAETQVPPSS